MIKGILIAAALYLVSLSPVSSWEVKPGSITPIVFVVTDNVGVASSKVYIDGVLMATFFGDGTHEYLWQVPKANKKTYIITILAWDEAGNQGVDSTTIFSVRSREKK